MKQSAGPELVSNFGSLPLARAITEVVVKIFGVSTAFSIHGSVLSVTQLPSLGSGSRVTYVFKAHLHPHPELYLDLISF